MEHIENKLTEFSNQHPIWFWLLVRLTICICWTLTVIAAILAFIVLIAPFCGSIIGIWVLLPILIVFCWACVSAAIYLYKTFCESW